MYTIVLIMKQLFVVKESHRFKDRPLPNNFFQLTVKLVSKV